ncbi:MAG: UDP-3-O-(3-hydroxymyristoyl)glucosamine N-acyltransferase [Acidobacteriaceae bacterium]
MSKPEITVSQIHQLLRLEPSEDERVFSRLSSYEDAGLESIVFAQDAAAMEKALASEAGLILAPLGATGEGRDRVLEVRNPKYAFAACGRWFDSFAVATIHPSAVIDAQASVGYGTSVGAGAVIEAGAVVGEHCVIGSNVTIYGNAVIGDHVLIQAGAVIGAMGFGYVRGEDGSYLRFPQQGRVVIEDEVEIGANSTIDRGALGETRVGRGTKIDNQVHIGHNCRIGKNVVMASQVGISGSCVVEDGAVLAGQVGLGDHVHIGPGVILGGASGVFPGKHLEGPGQMFMGVPAEPLEDYLRTVARVRRLKGSG